MRIECEQCGKHIRSKSCANWCDESIRWRQFQDSQAEFKKFKDEKLKQYNETHPQAKS